MQPGLLPIISGRYTKDKITAACIFKDAYSGFTYVHLMSSCNLDRTVAAKQDFEKIASIYGATKTKQYHADNEHFACKGFRDVVSLANQKIIFCGVAAHHQNSIIENQIGLLTRWARTSLLHARRRRPNEIATILWPYGLKSSCSRYNEFHFDKNSLSP